MSVDLQVKNFGDRWAGKAPAERANAQLYLIELADALGLPRPGPRGSGYEFEFPIASVAPDGTTTTKFADLFKEGCFLLESKDAEDGPSKDLLLRRAFGQVSQYAAFVPGGPPPYLMVLDVGQKLVIWDRWAGSYGGFKAGREISLKGLPGDTDSRELLHDIWLRPHARNPRERAGQVTQEIAGELARLASSLERRGFQQEDVARFLMRCVFTMFAEDVELLAGEPFRKAIEDVGYSEPEEFSAALADLWLAMDEGKRFGYQKLLRFNGHLFRNAETLPLTRSDLVILHQAAKADWKHVDPSIFGTLLVRALDPDERHRLGAQFTPPEFVERVVQPTIEAPIREEWMIVQAEVLQLRRCGKKADEEAALSRLRAFHRRLCSLKVLDPACGSGNFLYVALATLKRIELEVLREIETSTGNQEAPLEQVGPAQLHGIEIKPWAREITELTVWIGYHQWWQQAHAHTHPPEPVLKDTGTFECRDAVLAYDGVGEDPQRSRPDPTPRISSPVTGELVPDPEATLPYMEHLKPRPAEWPAADFIIGNPPYMGRGRQRDAFGDGYVDALRAAYPEVPDNADYVMYWWYRAARQVAAGQTIRAGLITTNTITQRHNREVIEAAREDGTAICWAAPDHPWVDESGSAAVRVAMTVMAKDAASAIRVEVDDEGNVLRDTHAAVLNADLSATVDVAAAAATPLRSNEGLSSQGFTLVGAGFRLDSEEGERLLRAPEHQGIVRPAVNGRDLTKRARGIYTIDFGTMSEEEARRWPVLYNLLRDRVRPARAANKRAAYAKYWWRFGETRTGLRAATQGLTRYIATPETAKHRVFQFLDASVAAEHSVVCIALDDPYHLGVLSSTIHIEWASAAGGRLGVGNDPRYQKAMTLDAFPFPEADESQQVRIATVAEQIEAHRRDGLDRDEAATITGMYNVLEKLKTGEELTDRERRINEVAACGVLHDLHKELDRLVAEAYGWSWPMEREAILQLLVALHDERVEEEAVGKVRWLRPDYQRPRAPVPDEQLELPEPEARAEPKKPAMPWPADLAQQIIQLRELLTTGRYSPAEIKGRFKGSKLREIEQRLEVLAVLGEVEVDDDGRYYSSSKLALGGRIGPKRSRRRSGSKQRGVA